MNKLKAFTLISVITVSSVSLLGLKNGKNLKVKTNHTPEENYQSYCSGCHGAKVNAFADRKWKYGKSQEALFKSIKFGYADGGMPAFAKTFTDNEIKALADYIIKGIENVDRYSSNEKPKSDVFDTEDGKIKLVKVFGVAKEPWGMAFLPSRQMLVTDKSGKLYLVGDGDGEEISDVPEVRYGGQGGLMDVILHPSFSQNKTVYLSYSKPHPTDKNLQTTAIFKATLSGNKLVNGKDIFVAEPYSRTKHHYGSRMVFGTDGLLYFSVGERGNEKGNPQFIKNGLGKIHRITADGEVPNDNPFYNRKDADQTIYSYGHRNPQGLTLNPFTQQIWEHEHGPRGGNEINTIKKGENYGWPVVSYGINYNGQIITPITQKKGIQDPLHY